MKKKTKGKKKGYACRIAGICAMALLLAGCAAGAFQKSDAAKAALEQRLTEIQADGVVTPEEWASYQQLAGVYYTQLKEDTSKAGVGWAEAALAALAVFVPGGAALAGTINAYRNAREKTMWNTPEHQRAFEEKVAKIEAMMAAKPAA
jgi:hypothetical protein